MKIYIQRHSEFAGKWIYSGYAHAWAYLDHQVKFISQLEEIKDDSSYLLFITDGIVTENNLKYLKNSHKTFLYVQPNEFPHHWGKHPNFISALQPDIVNEINGLKNVIKWFFGYDTKTYFTLWKNVVSMPLAYDNINYFSDESYNHDYDYDICFIGGFANNGFNEKITIIQNTLNAFLKAGFKCGFSVGQNISHELENYVLNRSKVALNVHDLYQRTLGLDTNERTFKSLGCNGILISDCVKQLGLLFPHCYQSNNLDELIEKTKEFCQLDLYELSLHKKQNKKIIEEKHTYIKRVQQFLKINENFHYSS
jgi:hypothetical protein